MSQELFIYWRTRPGQGAPAVDAARRFQADLRRSHPDLLAALYQRVDAAGDQITLMETYRQAGGLPAALQAQVVDAGHAVLAPWRDGARHVELFSPLPA